MECEVWSVECSVGNVGWQVCSVERGGQTILFIAFANFAPAMLTQKGHRTSRSRTNVESAHFKHTMTKRSALSIACVMSAKCPRQTGSPILALIVMPGPNRDGQTEYRPHQ